MYQRIISAFKNTDPEEVLWGTFWIMGVFGLAASAAMLYSVFVVYAARLGAELAFVGKTALAYEVLINMPIIACFGYVGSDVMTAFCNIEMAPKKAAIVSAGITTLGLSIAIYLIDFGVI